MHQIGREMQACTDECQRCHATCLSMAMNQCLEAGGEHVAPGHFRIMADCPAMRATAADFMLSGSAHRAAMCGVCAGICAACAESCEALDGLEDCVAACRACEASCRKMAQAA